MPDGELSPVAPALKPPARRRFRARGGVASGTRRVQDAYTPTLADRLLAKVDALPLVGCWPWRGVRTAGGYGCLRDGHRVRYAHRVACELLVGAIPDGLVLDHLCRNRACLRPDHLEPVTNEENLRRGRAARAEAA